MNAGLKDFFNCFGRELISRPKLRFCGALIMICIGLSINIGCAIAEGLQSTIKIGDVSWTDVSSPEVRAMLDRERLGLIGQTVDEKGLISLQDGLTTELRSAGYLIGRIVVSSHDRGLFIRTGNLRFTIFLGRVGAISVKNTSLVDGDWIDSLVGSALCPDGVGEQCILERSNFERMTQLLQDTVGLTIQALSFDSEGMPLGQTRLSITTAPKGSRINGSIGLDNQGFSSTGKYRVGLTASMANLFQVGDVLGVNIFSSNKGAVSGSIEASGPLHVNGLRWQSSVGRSEFALPSTQSSGFGNSVGVGVAYPLMRGLDLNWVTAFNAVGVVTTSQTAGITTTNKTLTSGQFTLDGNSGDRSISLGQNAWFSHSALTIGRVGDAAWSNSTGVYAPLGAYTKFAFQDQAKLILSDAQSIYSVLNIKGQFANTNLDPYEKLAIGGFSNMRAYGVETGSFNQGFISSIDLRKSFNTPWGQFTPMVFFDYGNGWINHSTYPNWQINSGYSNSGLSNHLVLSDAGLAIDWVGFHGFAANMTWAQRLPSSPVAMNSSGNANSQFWFLVQSRF